MSQRIVPRPDQACESADRHRPEQPGREPRLTQIARQYIHGPQIPEAMLNRVEAGIRTFDPWLSCSTPAAGMMRLQISLIGPGGRLLDKVL